MKEFDTVRRERANPPGEDHAVGDVRTG